MSRTDAARQDDSPHVDCNICCFGGDGSQSQFEVRGPPSRQEPGVPVLNPAMRLGGKDVGRGMRATDGRLCGMETFVCKTCDKNLAMVLREREKPHQGAFDAM